MGLSLPEFDAVSVVDYPDEDGTGDREFAD